jgi:glycosyltransferase involved in cell wall biosynthesis
MRSVWLPAARQRALETLSHSALSTAHAVAVGRPDVAFVFNAANAPFVRALQAAGIRCALHTDGLEWQRGKWGRAGRRYYLASERFGASHADTIISDAEEISRYYRDRYGRPSEVIAYGADVISPSPEPVEAMGLEPGGYYLAVARLEPENHVDVIVAGYSRTPTTRPLVVVGAAPYERDYQRRLYAAAARDPRVRMLGSVWDERVDALYAHTAMYLHGHSVGGTNPSLLRAMGAGAPVGAWDVIFNREVTQADHRCFFRSPDGVARLIADAEADPAWWAASGRAGQQRVALAYRWDDVASAYERVADKLASL